MNTSYLALLVHIKQLFNPFGDTRTQVLEESMSDIDQSVKMIANGIVTPTPQYMHYPNGGARTLLYFTQ